MTPVSVRRAFVSDPRRRELSAWSGVVAAALTLVLALEAKWGPAALCGVVAGTLLGLGGLWVSPWSSDAYARRVTRAWEAWATGAQWAYDAFTDRTTRFSARIQQLRPPREYEQEHARLLGMLSDLEEARTDRSAPDPVRVRRGVAAGRTIGEACQRLCATATGADQERYCRQLAEAQAGRHVEYTRATLKAEHATERLLKRLARMRVPPAASTDHESLVRGFDAYLAAARGFHAACQQELADDAAAAVTEMDTAVNMLRAPSTAIFASLEYEARWPQSDTTAEQ